MKRLVLSFALVMLMLVAATFANDVWKDKPYQNWDRKDVYKILNESPWSQAELLYLSGGPDFSAIDAGGEANGNAGGTYGGAGVTNAGPGAKSQKFIARWGSSRTIRKALLRNQQLNGQSSDTASGLLAKTPEYYELVLIGTDLQAFTAAGTDALRSNSFLETRTTRQKITPADVRFETDAGGSPDVVLEFPKKLSNGEPAIAPDEKGVDLFANAGKLKLKFHFDLSKMSDGQGLDL